MSNKGFRLLWFKLQRETGKCFCLTFPVALYIFQELLDSILDLLTFACSLSVHRVLPSPYFFFKLWKPKPHGFSKIGINQFFSTYRKVGISFCPSDRRCFHPGLSFSKHTFKCNISPAGNINIVHGKLPIASLCCSKFQIRPWSDFVRPGLYTGADFNTSIICGSIANMMLYLLKFEDFMIF
jgi:hypothetical protein